MDAGTRQFVRGLLDDNERLEMQATTAHQLWEATARVAEIAGVKLPGPPRNLIGTMTVEQVQQAYLRPLHEAVIATEARAGSTPLPDVAPPSAPASPP